MDQQDHGPDTSQVPVGDEEPVDGRRRPADESAANSNWGLGAASAMDNLRRHDYRARRSRPAEKDGRPTSK